MLIFLVGFMGSGKSFHARELAETLAMGWLDLDDCIEQAAGQTISAFFAEKGEEAFRLLEKKVLQQTVNTHQNLILATGGGTPCFYDNMEWMNARGQTIYLKAPTWLLYRRLQNQTIERPLVAGKTATELTNFIDQKLAEREAFYSRADLIYFLQDNESKNRNDLLTYFTSNKA